MSTGGLEAAIAEVKGYTCRTVMASRLKFSAVLVLRLRQAVLSDNWARAKALLEDPSPVVRCAAVLDTARCSDSEAWLGRGVWWCVVTCGDVW